MSLKIKPLQPVKPNLGLIREIQVGVMTIVQLVLWLIMIIAGFTVLVFWVNSLMSKGVFDQLTIQYSAIIAVGAYFCLVIDNDKIYNAMKIKKELPFISPESNKFKESR